MFGWLKKQQVKKSRAMVGDLDLLTKKEFFVKYKGREWRIPELTAREYAEFCALLSKLEEKTKAKEPDEIDEIYSEIFAITVPELPGRIVRKMPLSDSHAMFVTILKHYGFDMPVDTDKKKEGQKRSQKTSS